MLEKYLQDIGFSDKEAKVYLTLLQVDNSSVLDLAKKTKIKRPTVYVVLESLLKKGLVSESVSGKKIHYHAESPERLTTYVERQKIALDDQIRQLKDVIPQIKSIQRESGEKPTVQYFEGKEGIYSMSESLYEDEKENTIAYMVYSRDLLDKTFPLDERNKFRQTRIRKKIKSRVIYNYSKGIIPSDDTGERIRVDETIYPFSCDISIHGDRVRIAILDKKLSGIFIKSKEFADTLKSLFLLAFNANKNK